MMKVVVTVKLSKSKKIAYAKTNTKKTKKGWIRDTFTRRKTQDDLTGRQRI